MRPMYVSITALIKTVIFASLVAGIFGMSVSAHAYSYPNPPTSNGAVTTANKKCTGAFISELGGDGSDSPPSAPSWSVLAWGFIDGSLLPSNYNTPNTYCIQASLISNASTWGISYGLYSGTGISSASNKYTLTYTDVSPVPVATLSVSPTSITSGYSSALTWSSTNATSCTGTGFSTGGALSGTVSVSPSQTTTYSVSCTGAGGTAQGSATLTVTAPSQSPTVSLTASPSTITVGSSTTLSWTSSNASYCSSIQFDTAGATSGSITIVPNASTNYTVTCTGSSGGGTGTWQYYQSDYSDLSCPVSSNNNVYSAVPDCPASPQGKSCTSPPSTCKINTIGPGCGVSTDVYSCQVTSPPPSVSFSATVNVTSNNISRSCSVSPTSIYNNGSATWTASPSSIPSSSGECGGELLVGINCQYAEPTFAQCGPNERAVPSTTTTTKACSTNGYSYTGNFGGSCVSDNSCTLTYLWSGTDGLSGSAYQVTKQYTTTGTKTGSVVISSGDFPIEGQKECSGGTLYATDSSTEDGVAMTSNSSAFSSTCANMTPKGGCCQLQVREYQNSTGQPVSTTYAYKSYTGGSLITKDSYTAPAGSNQNVYNFYAGTERADCSTNLVVSSNLPDLTPGALSPSSVTAGVSSTFTLGVINTGSAGTAIFGSTVYACLASDTACLNNHLAKAPSFFDIILAFFGRIAEAGTSIKIPLSRISLSAGTSGSQTGSYTFTSSGAYKIRSCVDTPLNEVPEANENDNCSAWADFTVNPVVLNVTCSVSPTSGYTNDNITWTATPSGGTGTYTYSWSGTDSLSGTTQSVVKQYTTVGTKAGSVTVTSGASSVTKSCSNSTSIAASPTALLSASPNVIIRGSGSSQLSWSSTNATSCTSTKFSTGGATSGNLTVTPSDTTTYDLTCMNAAKSVYSTAVVTVYVADLTLTVSPNTSVRRNDPATINWSVSGSPDSCFISGPGLSSTAFSGSQSVIVGQESTYTLSCTKEGATVSKSITIKLTPAFEEF